MATINSTDGQNIFYTDTIGKTKALRVPNSLFDLDDVLLSNPQAYDTIGYDSQSGKWRNYPPSSPSSSIDSGTF